MGNLPMLENQLLTGGVMRVGGEVRVEEKVCYPDNFSSAVEAESAVSCFTGGVGFTHKYLL
jgi:hypothetical protein